MVQMGHHLMLRGFVRLGIDDASSRKTDPVYTIWRRQVRRSCTATPSTGRFEQSVRLGRA